MKRRVADELEWANRHGLDRDSQPWDSPGPKVKRRAKRRINRLERRESKAQLNNKGN